MKMGVLSRYILFFPLIFFLLFSSTEFFLLLRHKSPYVSDSYFYQHIYYTFQGDTFEKAYAKTLSQIDLAKVDLIERNFYLNQDRYQDSLRFFTKRPLYPFLAYISNLLVQSNYVSFLLPVFGSFVGCIVLVYYLSLRSKVIFLAIYTTAGLLLFYPFLDWSTYFLTDTIGTFFWLLQLIFIYHAFRTHKSWWFWMYGVVLMIALLNREQSFLMVLFFGILGFLFGIFSYEKKLKYLARLGFILSLIISLMYIFIMGVTGQKTLFDTLVYTQNNYGLYSNNYSFFETVSYLMHSIARSHLGFFKDLTTHHWWFVHVVFGVLGIVFVYFKKRGRPTLLDQIMLASGLASYAAIFLYPVLSYRYFIPVVVTLLFFSAQAVYVFCVPNINLDENKK